MWTCQGHAVWGCPPSPVETKDFAWKLNSLHSSLLSICTKCPFEANQNSAKVTRSHNNFIFAAEAWGKVYNAEGSTILARQYWYFFKETLGLLCEKLLVWPHYSNDTDVSNNFDTDFKQVFLFFTFLPPKIFTSAQLSPWNKKADMYRESCIKSSPVLQKSMEWHSVFTEASLSGVMRISY